VAALRDERVLHAIGSLIENKLAQLIADNQTLTQELQGVSSELQQTKTLLNDARDKIDALESYNRRDNLILAGVPLVSYAEAATATTTEESSAETEQAVISVLNKLDLPEPVTLSSISTAHRLRKSPTDPGPPRIIVRFTNRRIRNAVYAARKQLAPPRQRSETNNTNTKSSANAIYINEDLTSRAADLFKKARKLVKDHKLFGTWTAGGVVHVRQSAAPNCKPVKVLHDSDLLQFL
jgi:hypothetical protein